MWDAHWRCVKTTGREFTEWEIQNGRWALEPDKPGLLLDPVHDCWYAPWPLWPQECEVDNTNYESIQELTDLDEYEK